MCSRPDFVSGMARGSRSTCTRRWLGRTATNYDGHSHSPTLAPTTSKTAPILPIWTRDWRDHKEGKQTEFLLEQHFPWSLVSRIGVHSVPTRTKVYSALSNAAYQPPVHIETSWYY